MRFCMIDIGIRNTAIIIEEFDEKNINQLVNKHNKLIKSQRLKYGNAHSQPFKNILEKFEKSGHTLFLELFDPNGVENLGYCDTTRKNMYQFLQTHLHHFEKCDVIGIEEQFYNPAAGTVNKPALRLAECIYVWIQIHLPNVKIEYVPSTQKTNWMGCPKSEMVIDENTGYRINRKWVKKDRKKWSAEYALSIYTNRKDENMLTYYKNTKKKDDIGDCLLMVIAYILRNYVSNL